VQPQLATLGETVLRADVLREIKFTASRAMSSKGGQR
jgi:hypothetical protein